MELLWKRNMAYLPPSRPKTFDIPQPELRESGVNKKYTPLGSA